MEKEEGAIGLGIISKHILFPGLSLSRSLSLAGSDDTFYIHTHTNVELLYFVSGKGTYYVEGSKYPLSPGDLLLVRPGEAHFVEPDLSQDYDRIVLNFDPTLFSALDPEEALLHPFVQREAGKHNRYTAAHFDTHQYQKYLFDMFQCENDRLSLLANLILLLREIDTAFLRVDLDSVSPNAVEYEIIRYINQNLHREISIQELSEQFFLSRAQLCLRFKNAIGTSVGKYITIKRLMLARQQIRQGEKPTDVFSACGYQDYSTFYRAYIRLFGHSPKQEASCPTVSAQDDYIGLK